MSAFRSRVVVGKGRAEVEIDQPFVKDLEKIVQKTIPRSVGRIQDVADDVRTDARRLWPARLITTRRRNWALKSLLEGNREPYHKVLGEARKAYRKALTDPARSRNQFDQVVRLSRDALEVVVRNRAPYAYYIKPAWPYEDVINDEKRAKNPARDLLLKPGTDKRLVDDLARSLADELLKISEGR